LLLYILDTGPFIIILCVIWLKKPDAVSTSGRALLGTTNLLCKTEEEPFL